MFVTPVVRFLQSDRWGYQEDSKFGYNGGPPHSTLNNEVIILLRGPKMMMNNIGNGTSYSARELGLLLHQLNNSSQSFYWL